MLRHGDAEAAFTRSMRGTSYGGPTKPAMTAMPVAGRPKPGTVPARAVRSAPATSAPVPAPKPPVPTPFHIELGRFADNGEPFYMDLRTGMSGRVVLQGQTGSGKSTLLRRFLEQCMGKIQAIVLDPEEEYVTLAELFDITVIPVHEIAHEEDLIALAQRIRETRISVVLDLSKLAGDDAALMDAASAILCGLHEVDRTHWHPCVVAVDEAQMVAPRAADDVEAKTARRKAVGALSKLMARGRKRGITAVLAIPRFEQVATAPLSRVSNFLIGRCDLDVDIARAAGHLGWRVGTANDRLTALEPGHFIASGPAVSGRPREVIGGEVKSRHVGATPELTPPPVLTKEAISQALGLDRLLQPSEPARAVGATTPASAFEEEPPLLHAIAAIWRDLDRIAPKSTNIGSIIQRTKLPHHLVWRALEMMKVGGLAIRTHDKNWRRPVETPGLDQVGRAAGQSTSGELAQG